ncbi:hypothetical protein AVEN_85236-1 [Araneus ventricosus]|uniref:Uncharacterized protein n=1 Tax=Araneus ventricosus TaxID=182803 RepID=A0A4Y2SKN6_ARAVE|nr:hypothetical protein AVEN_85236-1 [Araneus ventricosus]
MQERNEVRRSRLKVNCFKFKAAFLLCKRDDVLNGECGNFYISARRAWLTNIVYRNFYTRHYETLIEEGKKSGQEFPENHGTLERQPFHKNLQPPVLAKKIRVLLGS